MVPFYVLSVSKKGTLFKGAHYSRGTLFKEIRYLNYKVIILGVETEKHCCHFVRGVFWHIFYITLDFKNLIKASNSFNLLDIRSIDLNMFLSAGIAPTLLFSLYQNVLS